MLQEIRFALRSLAKTPTFTLIAIATLALAIGANSAIFSLVNALLIRPLPYKNPQQLVLLWEKFSAQGLDRIPVSAPEYLDYTKPFAPYRVEFHPVRQVQNWHVMNGTGWVFDGKEQSCEFFRDEYNAVMRQAAAKAEREGITCEVTYL